MGYSTVKIENPSVLISSSPILSHPSTAILEETIVSVRYHWPEAPIWIMLDGVRAEQEHRRDDYEEYIQRLCFLDLKNVSIYKTDEFLHQAVLTMKTLENIKSNFMLFVEHDTPLVDAPIDWEMLETELEKGNTNHIRLHYDQSIHPDHQHMMRGNLTPNLIKCIQWHQRPHIARTEWYRKVLRDYFSLESRTFIEDKIYSPVSCEPWEKWRLTIYDPEGTGKNMQRSRDLNGRAYEPKYGLKF